MSTPPTLKSLDYDKDPPRCGNCTKRYMQRTKKNGKTTRQLMCALAQVPVHARGVCNAWRSLKDGQTLEPTP